ncbi:PDR/VanB family oxidoreductase [Pseudomonas sp. PSKL.D1]|uniref:PDR/VanB family oxidoreductase n=1 Tax=Pseudomonas sp. PSKL.D1 TaxID=3029060 RepID=UPI0023814410|nr:PDR/VanB family oxidoreductase [Pseudomonas sp. PSKL.D1]WDY60166.1 PDR/VanB family oxidoreductase [Pseudomonas sp. PSKL.D1]
MSAQGETLPVVISGMRIEAQGVMSLELRAADGGALPAWAPGAHIDLLLPSGLVRQYSLCGDPAQRHVMRIAVLLEAEGRGGSREVHGALRLGQALAIRGPRNAFPLQGGGAYLFVAGGIGVTPILAMVREAQRTGADWQMLYGGRSRRSMAFIDELQALGGGRVEVLPADEVGLLDLDAVVAGARAGRDVYSCGPSALLDALTARFSEAGLQQRLHLERFAPAPAPAAEAGEGLTVILARSGTQVRVPAGCSIMAALRAAGHEVASSCEQGVCGMCETRVLDGVPDHRDLLLSEGERAQGRVMMLCVSRALTPTLTLDL